MSDLNEIDGLVLASRTISMLNSMVDGGEQHTTRSREMMQNALEALANIGLANEANKQPDKALPLHGISGCLLPTKSQLKQVIEADYKQQYGTNYDESSLENAKQGGLIITNWILNNR